jgi:AcrR family transcriptional regulator
MTNAAGRETQELLILTAERLFALRGVDVVALREIGEAAGQRNSAVVNYYFGDRDGLIRAIFEYRLAEMMARRKEILPGVIAGTRPRTRRRLRGLIEAYVVPLAEQLLHGHYLGLIARMQLDFGRADERVPRWLLDSVAELLDQIRAEIDLPAPIIEGRMVSMVLLTVHGLATRQILDEKDGLTLDGYVADLVDSLEGLLTAKTSTRQVRSSSRA